MHAMPYDPKPLNPKPAKHPPNLPKNRSVEEQDGSSTTITNDGATVMKKLNIVPS